MAAPHIGFNSVAEIAQQSGTTPATTEGTNGFELKEVAVPSDEGVSLDPGLTNGVYLSKNRSKSYLKTTTCNVQVWLKPSGGSGSPDLVDTELRYLLEANHMRRVTATTPDECYYEPAKISDTKYLYTFSVWIDGLKRQIDSCIGINTVFNFQEDYPFMSCDLVGIYHAPADEANPSVTYDTGIPNENVNMSFTIGGYAAVLSVAPIISMNQSYTMRTSGNAARGVHSPLVTSINPTIRFTCETDDVATKDFLTELNDGDDAAISFTNGSVVGKKIVVTAPKAVITRAAMTGDRDSVMKFEIEADLVYDVDTDTAPFRISWQ